MISSSERADLLRIMKVNRLTLSELDTAHLTFNGQFAGDDYEVMVLVLEDAPSAVVKKSGQTIHSETVQSVEEFEDLSRRTAVPVSGNLIMVTETKETGGSRQ